MSLKFLPDTASKLNEIYRKVKCFDGFLKKVKVLSFDRGGCVAEITVEEEHTNGSGVVHDGFSASLIDSISGFGLCSHKYGSGVPHLSVKLSLEYIKRAKMGDHLEITSNPIHVGKTLAYLEVFIKNKKTGEVLVKGAHTRYIMAPLPPNGPHATSKNVR